MIISVFFNGYKNILRINKENFINDPRKTVSIYFRGPHKFKIDNFTYYVGWYGKSPIGNESLEGYNHKKKFIFDIIYKK